VVAAEAVADVASVDEAALITVEPEVKDVAVALALADDNG
jgi:hypothetical protein